MSRKITENIANEFVSIVCQLLKLNSPDLSSDWMTNYLAQFSGFHDDIIEIKLRIETE